jgi:hypothetical protein
VGKVLTDDEVEELDEKGAESDGSTETEPELEDDVELCDEPKPQSEFMDDEAEVSEQEGEDEDQEEGAEVENEEEQVEEENEEDSSSSDSEEGESSILYSKFHKFPVEFYFEEIIKINYLGFIMLLPLEPLCFQLFNPCSLNYIFSQGTNSITLILIYTHIIYCGLKQ